MLKTYYKVKNANGQPLRFYLNSKIKAWQATADDKYFNQYISADDAQKFATLAGLDCFEIESYQRDLGTPTSLSEIGF
jgi:hypothetical protein